MPEKGDEKSKSAKFLLAPSLFWLALFIVAPLVIVVVVSFATRGAYGKTSTRAQYSLPGCQLWFQGSWEVPDYGSEGWFCEIAG